MIDLSYERIRSQLFSDFSHLKTLLRLAEGSPPETILSLSYYCRGVLNASKLLWQFIDCEEVWTALYIKVDELTQKATGASDFISSQQSSMLSEMKSDQEYVNRVLACFEDSFLGV